jgi:hypothetical protein
VGLKDYGLLVENLPCSEEKSNQLGGYFLTFFMTLLEGCEGNFFDFCPVKFRVEEAQ